MHFTKTCTVGALIALASLLVSQPCQASDLKLYKYGATLTITHEENISSPSPGNCPTGLSEPCDSYVLNIPYIAANPSGDAKADLKNATGISLAFAATCSDIVSIRPSLRLLFQLKRSRNNPGVCSRSRRWCRRPEAKPSSKATLFCPKGLPPRCRYTASRTSQPSLRLMWQWRS